jgi:FKBP-type peptidyl-prolyl cis-trans isomerase
LRRLGKTACPDKSTERELRATQARIYLGDILSAEDMMKKPGLLIAALVVLAAGLGYVMHAMDVEKHPPPLQIPKKAESVRERDLKRLTDPNAHNWQLDLQHKVIKTKTGLQYQDIAVGKGAKPNPGDLVLVDYVGWNVRGASFDTSLGDGREPLPFRVGRHKVIKGWDEGVLSMRKGGVRRLVIPPDLAYGPMGAPPAIEPNATLVFMVKLLEVKP